MTMESWLVAPEYDEPAFKQLGDALRSLGYLQVTHQWGLGGSQEISEWTVRGPDGTLDLTAETYMGLQVCGPAALVHALQIAYRNQAAR